MSDADDCERGIHQPLEAHAPIENETDVEIDYICPACGQIEYTESWTKASWQKAHPPTRTEAQHGVTDGR